MMTILIIDDEKPTLEMLRLYLEACGYRVLTAADAAEGLAVFEKERPPVVLTDIKMPGQDGFVVVDRIKAASPETDVIVMSGHGDKDLERQALDRQARAYFNKPLDTAALELLLQAAGGGAAGSE